jgi:predicted amidohydrolase
MAQILHLAVGSTTSKPGAVGANLEQIVMFARRAADDGAQLLLTPEMSASGYGNRPEVLATAEVAGHGPVFETLAATAAETGVVLCAGFVEQGEAKRHLSHYAVFPDGTYVVQRKHRVTQSERPLEPEWPQEPPFGGDGTGTAPRVDFRTFEVGGVRATIAICADTGIEDIHQRLDDLGVRLLLAPTGAGGLREDRVTTEELKTAAGRKTYQRVLETVFFPGPSITECIAHRRTLAAVNLCGYDGHKHYHTGHGMIITPMGEVPAFFHGLPNLDRQRPMYAHAEVDFEECV